MSKDVMLFEDKTDKNPLKSKFANSWLRNPVSVFNSNNLKFPFESLTKSAENTVPFIFFLFVFL